MNPKEHAGGGSKLDGHLKMVNGVFRTTLGMIYLAQNAVTVVNLNLLALLREIDSAQWGFFRGAESFVLIGQQPN